MALAGSLFLKQGEPGTNDFKYVEIVYRETTPAEGSIASLQQVLALTLKGKWKGGDNSVDHTFGNYKIGTGFGSVSSEYLSWEWSSLQKTLTLFEVMKETSGGNSKTAIATFADCKKSGSKLKPVDSDVRAKATIIFPGNSMTRGPAYWEDVL